jgi:hypothetical protein
MSAVEIPRLRRANARSRPSFRRAWAAGNGMELDAVMRYNVRDISRYVNNGLM